MIDRRARDLTALNLRRFVQGRLSNFEFEESEPQSRDPAIQAIYGSVWPLYDDFKSHTLTAHHRLPPALRRDVVRWIIFLDGNLPYAWPELPSPGLDPMQSTAQGWWERLFGPLEPRHPTVSDFLAAGHYPVWPFTSQADYRAALRNPRRLARHAPQ